MKFFLADTLPAADVLFLPLYKNESVPVALKKMLGSGILKQVETRMKAKDFEGEENQALTLFPEGGKWKRLVMVGCGEKGKNVPQVQEFLGAKLADIAKTAKTASIAICLNGKEWLELGYGIALSAYEFTRYKTPEKKPVILEKITFCARTSKADHARINELNVYAKISPSLRDLVNICANEQNPMSIAKYAQKTCKPYKMKVTVLDEKKLKKLGCGGIIGMGKGAAFGPCMVIIEHRYKSSAKKPSLAFVGKGITFDTGGLNLKPTGHIETMKLDMAGAATVLATLQALAELKVPGYFIAVMPCAENAISDKALHPGDVVKTYNGKTVEVNNTDAEGRMVLADALAYTEKNYSPKYMIDIATLTGAVTVALGYNITGVLGNDQKLVDHVLNAAKNARERMWQLPLDEDFVKLTKGTYSDLQNATDGVRAGTIMGAAFLKNFVDKTPWVHLDIGGTAWAEKPTPLTKYGSTAVALRTFISLGQKLGSL